VFINCQVALRLSEFLKAASAGYQSHNHFQTSARLFLPSGLGFVLLGHFLVQGGQRKGATPWLSIISCACRTSNYTDLDT
jgi:hypothetical protein